MPPPKGLFSSLPLPNLAIGDRKAADSQALEFAFDGNGLGGSKELDKEGSIAAVTDSSALVGLIQQWKCGEKP